MYNIRNMIRTIVLLPFVLSMVWGTPQSVEEGKALYEMTCFTCHGKQLEGGIGFNLKDADWVHGGSREKIIETIGKGFPEKGMMSFSAIYKPEQIGALADFILSKQEGLRDLEYKIYHNATVENSVDWGTQTPSKSGLARPPYINLNLPEVDQFAISYSGELMIPYTEEYKFNGVIRQKDGLELLIDGKPLEVNLTKRSTFEMKMKLTSGTHSFELRYIKNFKNSDFILMLIGKKGNIPLSLTAYHKLHNNSHIVAVTDKSKIVRKRFDKLPAGSICVAHPGGVNYAFDPRSGSVNAFWLGKFMDIGPHISNRGQGSSRLLGKLIVQPKDSLQLKHNLSSMPLSFKGYSNLPGPAFDYEQGALKVTVSSIVTGKQLSLNYKLKGANVGAVTLPFPTGLKVTSDDGDIVGNVFTVSPSKKDDFTITIEGGGE